MRQFASIFTHPDPFHFVAGKFRKGIPMILQRLFLPSVACRWLCCAALAVVAACATEPEPPVKCEAAGCNDGNPCTKDECEPPTGCKHAPLDGGACTDGDVCTTSDACKAGACAPGASLSCKDDNVCT